MSEEKCWTIATREQGAPVFDRITDWAGTWDEARDMAWRVGKAHPDVDVWYTSTRADELTERVVREDVMNILADDGERIPIREHGTLADLLA